MSRRVKIPYHIPGGASGFLLMDVDTASGVSMPTNATNASSSGGGFRWTLGGLWGYGSPDNPSSGSYELVIPAGIPVILFKGSGGGGGGGGGASGSGAGGGGGGPSPQYGWQEMEIDESTGATLTIYVGAAGSGGAIGSAGTDGEESYIYSASGIISPLFISGKFSFGLGLKGNAGSGSTGGNSGGPAWSDATKSIAFGTLNSGSAHAAKWLYTTDGNVMLPVMMPICQGPGGRGPSSSITYAALTMNGQGSGTAPAGDTIDGGGGGGGGSGACKGGNGGDPTGPVAAQTGTGPGAGGGGGKGNQAGADGTIGYVAILVPNT